MTEFEKLSNRIRELENKVRALELSKSQQTEFQDNFSSKIIYNKEIQFMQKVYDKDGNIVIEINP